MFFDLDNYHLYRRELTLKLRGSTMRINDHFLAITALGNDSIGVLEAFTKAAKQCCANILDAKLKKIGSECALTLYFTGTWSAIAKLEALLPQLAKQHEFILQSKRTQPSTQAPALPYHVQVIAQDRPGILNDLALFFTQNKISIEQMESETYTAKNQTVMSNISLLINIPVKKHIASLREKFIIYCEDLNLDALIEPAK
jgi:glycine cleavage system transcriptional repressor